MKALGVDDRVRREGAVTHLGRAAAKRLDVPPWTDDQEVPVFVPCARPGASGSQRSAESRTPSRMGIVTPNSERIGDGSEGASAAAKLAASRMGIASHGCFIGTSAAAD